MYNVITRLMNETCLTLVLIRLSQMNELAKIVSNSDSIAITSHINPDGDSIGSILALGLALKQVRM